MRCVSGRGTVAIKSERKSLMESTRKYELIHLKILNRETRHLALKLGGWASAGLRGGNFLGQGWMGRRGSGESCHCPDGHRATAGQPEGETPGSLAPDMGVRERGQGNTQVQVGCVTDGTTFSQAQCAEWQVKRLTRPIRCEVAAYWDLGMDGPVWMGDRKSRVICMWCVWDICTYPPVPTAVLRRRRLWPLNAGKPT